MIQFCQCTVDRWSICCKWMISKLQTFIKYAQIICTFIFTCYRSLFCSVKVIVWTFQAIKSFLLLFIILTVFMSLNRSKRFHNAVTIKQQFHTYPDTYNWFKPFFVNEFCTFFKISCRQINDKKNDNKRKSTIIRICFSESIPDIFQWNKRCRHNQKNHQYRRQYFFFQISFW